MNRQLTTLGAILVIGILAASTSLFVIDETEQAIVLRFGEHIATYQEPGLKVKVPIIDSVVVYDKRVLDRDPSGMEVILSDQTRLSVDAFIRYRISVPLEFYQAVRNEENAGNRLDVFLQGALRRVLANERLQTILSEKRSDMMADISNQVRRQARGEIIEEDSGESTSSESPRRQSLGIEIVDVRIRRADLPEATSNAIYDRMTSEREQAAALIRAEGNEEAQALRATANRETVEILAEARRTAQLTRGEGDEEAIRVYGESFGRDPEFFSFYRTLEAYREALTGNDTTMVLSPDSEFFRYFGDISGGASRSPGLTVPDLPQPTSGAGSPRLRTVPSSASE